MSSFCARIFSASPQRVLVVLARAVDSVPWIVDENGAGVHIMCYLDGRRRRQSLVYFGKV